MQASPCARDNRDNDKSRLHFNYVINVCAPSASALISSRWPDASSASWSWSLGECLVNLLKGWLVQAQGTVRLLSRRQLIRLRKVFWIILTEILMGNMVKADILVSVFLSKYVQVIPIKIKQQDNKEPKSPKYFQSRRATEARLCHYTELTTKHFP